MFARRDDQVFSREFLLFDADKYGGYAELFYKTEIRRRHSRNFVCTFDRLMEMAENCDSATGIIADSLEQTAHGILAKRMREHAPDDMNFDCVPLGSADYETVLEYTRA